MNEAEAKKAVVRARAREKAAKQLEKTSRNMRKGLTPADAAKSKAASDARIARGRGTPKAPTISETSKAAARNAPPADRRKTPRSGQRHAALDKARAQGRIQPRPAGHPNYQAPKSSKPPGYYKEIKPKWDHPAKNAVRSNQGTRAIANIKKGVDSARWSAGNLMYKASQTGAGKLLTKATQSGAGKLAGKVLGRVAAPLLVIQGAYDAARIGKAGYDAFSAGQSAKRNEADQSKRYGSVGAATRTRHANDRKRERVAKNNSNKLKTGYKLP
jgi:hypothetical protein